MIDEVVADLLVEIFQVNRRSLHTMSSLESAGLDSLARAELGAELKERFRFPIPEHLLRAATTLGELSEFLRVARERP
ncbi:acyl carrier protein [Kitasatospora sp. NPDC058046]|uniref:acyl carrier protein n=1 Tax=Kitasatospora sp. NPDC058046 TaxID=3346312 RepID=UPI0036DD8CE5